MPLRVREVCSSQAPAQLQDLVATTPARASMLVAVSQLRASYYLTSAFRLEGPPVNSRETLVPDERLPHPLVLFPVPSQPVSDHSGSLETLRHGRHTNRSRSLRLCRPR